METQDDRFSGRKCALWPAKFQTIANCISKHLGKGSTPFVALYSRGVRLFASPKQPVLTCGYKDKDVLVKVWGEFSKQLNSSLDICLHDQDIALEAAVPDWQLVQDCKKLNNKILLEFKKVDRLQEQSWKASDSGNTDEALTTLLECQATIECVSAHIGSLKQKLDKISVLLDSQLDSLIDRSRIQNSVQRIKNVFKQSSLVLDACKSQSDSNIGSSIYSTASSMNAFTPDSILILDEFRLLQSTQANIAWAKAWVLIMNTKGDIPTYNQECKTVCANILDKALIYQRRFMVNSEHKAGLQDALKRLTVYANEDNGKIEKDAERKKYIFYCRLEDISQIIEKLEKNIPAQMGVKVN